MGSLYRFVPALASTAVFCLTGCVPTTWLPDSSGFVYVKPLKGANPGDPPRGGQLVHFDIKKNSPCVIAEDIGPATSWPAVSPDGKRIAVARFKGGDDNANTKIQLVFYDLEGKQISQSKEFEWWRNGNKGLPLVLGLLFWSPKEDMVLFSDFTFSCIYDVRQDDIKIIGLAAPVIHGGTPMRPDGKGFLAWVGDNNSKSRSLVFVDWNGKQTAIDTKKMEALVPKGMPDSRVLDWDWTVGMSILPLMIPSGWEGNTAWAGVRSKRMTLDIDTAKKVVSVSNAMAETAKKNADGRVYEEPITFDLGEGIYVRLMKAEPGAGQKEVEPSDRLEVANSKTAKTETLLEMKMPVCIFLPSPDGNYLAICTGSKMGGGLPIDNRVILLVNKKGELVAKIAIDE